MALLFPASQRVTTAAGLPISGGKARIYNINTTTLASVFSDEAMATGLTNPVVADANGWFPAIYATEGSYDIALLSAADVVLKSWTDWPTFQSGSSAGIERTLSGARVKIDGGDIGSGAIGVRINAGDPDPDDVGGNLRLGGWDGTQADSIWIDGAVVNFPEPTSVQEDGKRLTSVLETEPTAFTTASSVIIALPNDPTGQRCWRIRLYDLVFSSTTAVPGFQLSYDNGATYKSGASDYGWAYNGSSALTPGLDDAHTQITIMPATPVSSTTNLFLIDFYVLTVDSGAGNTLVWGRSVGVNVAGVAGPQNIVWEGAGRGSYTRATHIKFVLSTGTVTGKYNVVAERGFGE